MSDAIIAAIVSGLFGILTWWLSVRHERNKQNGTGGVVSGERTRSGIRFTKRIGLAILLVVVVTASLIYFLVRSRPGNQSEGKIAVAVLPFTNMSNDKNQEYFSDGLAEELLNVLAKNPKLQVTSRTSAFSFKGKDVDLKTIAERLKVSHIVEGSVRKAGSDLRITAQLIKTSTDSHLWSETYDRQIENIFEIQQDIAQSISQALKVTLEGRQLAQPQNTTMDAYNAYLLGRYFSERRNKEDQERALSYLEQALKMDPEYAPAWAALSYARGFQAFIGYIPKEEGFAQARREGERAIQLDPDLADGYSSLAWIQREYDWDWDSADASIRRALELKPGDADILLSAAYMQLTLGKTEEAIQFGQRAVEQNPLSYRAHGVFGSVLYAAGRLQEAETSIRKSMELYGPESDIEPLLGAILLAQGKNTDALETMSKSLYLPNQLYGKALVYHSMGKRTEADAALAQLLEEEASAFPIAQVYAHRNEIDKAFHWLERARTQRDAGMSDVKLDPLLRPLHRDPRWAAFLRSMKLPV